MCIMEKELEMLTMSLLVPQSQHLRAPLTPSNGSKEKGKL
jgi:hypothetical protein